MMDSASRLPNLESLVSLWPVASTLSEHLPVGDLITLARLSVALRVLLHGFAQLEDTTLPAHPHCVRKELNIGRHGTLYWQQLKDRAPFECSSSTHTKGPAPKPCRYCSKPICDACIVKSSFARGHENTFQNRTRYLCKTCWEDGNASRSQRFALDPSEDAKSERRRWYDPDGRTRDYCTCTLKDDGWLCLDCKDLQNWEAISSADTHCHGQDCNELLDADRDRRRICLWCNKALPRQIGGTTRHHWNQKMVEARARNIASRQADLEEYNRKRLKLMRMSRREMRGDEAVKDDPDADLPQFVRHMDTMNYRSFMPESAAPSGDSVYDSKRGYWRYSTAFLLKMRARCSHVSVPAQMKTFTKEEAGALSFARTNAEKLDDLFNLSTRMSSMTEDRLAEWCDLKAVMLEKLLVQKLSYATTQQIMRDDYGFDAGVEEYHSVLHAWCPADQIREYLGLSSLERESEKPESSQAASVKDPNEAIEIPAEDPDRPRPKLIDPLDAAERVDDNHDDDDDDDTDKALENKSAPDESEADRHKRKIQQDREFLAQTQIQTPTPLPAPTETAAEPETADSSFMAAPSPTHVFPPLFSHAGAGVGDPIDIEAALLAGVETDDDLDALVAVAVARMEETGENQDEDESPPPYTADGWEWPVEEEVVDDG